MSFEQGRGRFLKKNCGNAKLIKLIIAEVD